MFDSVLFHILWGQKYKDKLRIKEEENKSKSSNVMGFVEEL